MLSSIRFAYPFVIYIGVPLVLLICVLRLWLYKVPIYKFPLADFLGVHTGDTINLPRYFFFFLRSLILLLLVLLCARPQLADITSNVRVEGIDIMVVLDVSGSMICFDDINDRRSRFEVAKQEAVNFVSKREYDQLGLVIFGVDAVLQCPLTLDKAMLTNILRELKLGMVEKDGTVLSMAMVVAANRLKNSAAKSKVMILLTDGEPTAELDIDPRMAVDVVKKLGVKVYTVGIGGEHGGLFHDPLFGVRPMGMRLNRQLLNYIAQETGGRYFEAKKPQDLEKIYGVIDSLEKSTYDTKIFSSYYEIYLPFLIAVCVLICIELFMAFFVWFMI